MVFKDVCLSGRKLVIWKISKCGWENGEHSDPTTVISGVPQGSV